MSIFNKKKESNEFEVELEDHLIPDGDVYRLHYVDYYKMGYDKHNEHISMMDWPFDRFKLPKTMSREDAFKILSYLSDFLEKDLKIEECSFKSVETLNAVLAIKRLGFEKTHEDKDEPIDLFTVRGRVKYFKNSQYYNKYFEWYTPNVSYEEVKEIYKKYGIDFYELKRVGKGSD